MRYVARLVRPRFEFAIVEVDLPGSAAHQDAATQILDHARRGEVTWQMSPFDPESYAAHVEMMMSDEDFLASEPDGNPAESGAVMTEIAEATRRYALLAGELYFADGLVIPQPWFHEDPEATRKLARGWQVALSGISGLPAVVKTHTKRRR